MKITRLDIEGFRSLRKVRWAPGDLNVIIGPNGAGKSNLLYFMKLISASARGGLGKYIQSLGGMDPVVWDGAAVSIKLAMNTEPVGGGKGPEHYELELVRLGSGSSYRVEKEFLSNSRDSRGRSEKNPFKFLERSARTAVIFDETERSFITPEEYISDEESLLSMAYGPFINNRFIPPFQKETASMAVYDDFRTHMDAPVRRSAISRMEKRVEPDGQNLISVMHTLYTGNRVFKRDIDSAMRAAFGDDFEELVFPPASDQRIQMRIRWKSLNREQSSAELSDGTLRFLFLITVMASPSPASVIAIDEPETGLHPSMLPVVAEYAVEAAMRSQVILTTHSPQFLDAFVETTPTTTIAKWKNGETILQTLEGKELDYWLKEYSLGSLFKSGELEQMI